MDILINVTSLIQKSTNSLFEKGSSVSLTTENSGATIFSSKEFYSLKMKFDYVNSVKIDKIVLQTYNEESCELMLIDGGRMPEEVSLNDSSEESSLVPGLYAIEVHLKDNSMYEYFYEILGQHTDENALSCLRDNINEYVHGLAINPSISGQSIISMLDETDHLIELMKRRWIMVKGQIELIQRNPVCTLYKTHVLRNELVRMDSHVIRHRDKHVGSTKVLQPRLSSHYDNPDNHALLNGLETFQEQLNSLLVGINDKIEKIIAKRSKLNEQKLLQLQDKEKLEKYHFDTFEIKSAAGNVNYTKMLIHQATSNLMHIRNQRDQLRKLSREVMQTKSFLEYKFDIVMASHKKDRPVTNVLYRNCIENMTKSQDIKNLKEIEPHSGFNYKRSEILFEYLGLLKIFVLLINMGYIASEELQSVVQEYIIPSGSVFHFEKGEQLIKILYDSEALSIYDEDYIGLVSENSVNRRPDMVLECFNKDEIVGIIIVEAKYRKVSYLHSNVKDSKGKYRRTEVEQTMSDYRSLKFYIPDKKEKDVDAVIVYYPNQEKTIPDNWGKDFGMLKKYGHFVPVDISSEIDEMDEFSNLLNRLISTIYLKEND